MKERQHDVRLKHIIQSASKYIYEDTIYIRDRSPNTI